jgi:hypothetical protein
MGIRLLVGPVFSTSVENFLFYFLFFFFFVLDKFFLKAYKVKAFLKKNIYVENGKEMTMLEAVEK